MKLTLYRADCTGKANNAHYPIKVEVTSPEQMAAATVYDHVCAEYMNCHRKKENFLFANVLPMDCDNNHIDNAEDWITPEKMELLFDETAYVLIMSRNNMKQKGRYSPRPRFHVYFIIPDCTSMEHYENLKARMERAFPFFDDKALDSARFFYGSPGKVIWHEGDMNIENLLCLLGTNSTIQEGSRNNAMHHFAVTILKRLGKTKEAEKAFLEYADKCSPPLDTDELRSIWRSALNFYKSKIVTDPDYVAPENYAVPEWVDPIPFSRYSMAKFPIEALPTAIAEYAAAVAESTQTPVDMAGAMALSIMSLCVQGKYKIRGKADWFEPLNTYLVEIAPPSERKSAIINLMLRPVNVYEVQYNMRNAPSVEANKMQKRILEKQQRAVEEQMSKGKASQSDVDAIAQQIASFREVKPMQSYVDDITPEKLVNVIAENKGRAAMISSEGGIFDTLAGTYSRIVNIDVMLKGYSGDTIRVDRIGRESESVMNPALTVLLMVQPSVIESVLSNQTFRGRGLTARFLYCMPISLVGGRRYRSTAISDTVYRAYERAVVDMLSEDCPESPAIITLSDDADKLLAEFAEEIEPKLVTDYAEMSDWAGKLIGNTLRIAGLLCRSQNLKADDFLEENPPLIVDEATMEKAILLGRYFLNHAQAAYSVLPENSMCKAADKILSMIREKSLTEFDRRTAMRYCRCFKTVAEIQPILDQLEDYGYIARKPEKPSSTGRPPLPHYLVNPKCQ